MLCKCHVLSEHGQFSFYACETKVNIIAIYKFHNYEFLYRSLNSLDIYRPNFIIQLYKYKTHLSDKAFVVAFIIHPTKTAIVRALNTVYTMPSTVYYAIKTIYVTHLVLILPT